MFDDEGNPLEESIAEITVNESLMEIEGSQDITTSTPKSTPREFAYNAEELNMKLAELESLKNELLNVANAKIASLEEAGTKKTNKIEKSYLIFEKVNKRLDEAKKGKKVDDPKQKKEIIEKITEKRN